MLHVFTAVARGQSWKRDSSVYEIGVRYDLNRIIDWMAKVHNLEDIGSRESLQRFFIAADEWLAKKRAFVVPEWISLSV
jgi:hypothetical protein